MTRSLPLLLGMLVLGCGLSGPVGAQTTTPAAPPATPPAPTTPTTPTMPETMPGDTMSTQGAVAGWRASKIIGASVSNEANDKIGTVDDLIIAPDEKVPVAVLSVGGFLGVGDKLVLVPYSQLSFVNDQLLMKGATTQSLTALPAYNYDSM